MRKRLTFFLLIFLLCSMAAASFAAKETIIYNKIRQPSCLKKYKFDPEDKILDIWFPNISNADAAILLYDGQVFLIDCGDEQGGERTAELLQKLGVTKVDRIFNSHPHHDHLLGLYNVHKVAPVDTLYVCFSHKATPTMIEAMTVAKNAHITVKDFTDGEVFAMGDGKVTLSFWRNIDGELDMNESSAITLLEYGNRRMLFTADIGRQGEDALLTKLTEEELRAEILRYPHHGKNGLTDGFFAAVQPSIAIIPNLRVEWGGVKFLKARKIYYYFANNGSKYVHLYSDGKIWVIEYVPYDKVTPWQTSEE